MNILYNIRHRGKIALLFLALIVLIAFNCNMYDKNIAEMGDSFSEVYADRLIAQDYIYKLSDRLHERKLVLAQKQGAENMQALFGNRSLAIAPLVSSYEKTKLTEAEQELFTQFKRNTLVLASLEKAILQEQNAYARRSLLASYEAQTTHSLSLLEGLSEVQLSRGKNLSDNSRRIVSYSVIINQFNWGLIILVGLIIQALVFSDISAIPKLKQRPDLN